MSDGVQFPLSYELNTRVWLAELSRRYGYRVTLANVPDEELQRLNDFHFDVIWLMGVWQTGSYSRELALPDDELLRYLAKVLPDWTEADIVSSPYLVSAYRVSEDLGDDAGLVAFRDEVHGLVQSGAWCNAPGRCLHQQLSTPAGVARSLVENSQLEQTLLWNRLLN
jgi:hypothetical protein